MQIRNRLSLAFTVISAILMMAVMTAIYLLTYSHTRADFYKALGERAVVAAQTFLEADELSAPSMQRIRSKYLDTLPGEVIRMYDSTDRASFIEDSTVYWPRSVINEVRSQHYLQYRSGSRQVVGIDYNDNQGAFVILASAVDVHGRARMNTLLKILLMAFLLQVVVLFIAGRWFAKKALEPIKKVNQRVQQITATDLHLRVPEGNNRDEITELAINFNQLLQRLESAFTMEKTFVANASHELRTPVTNIIGEIEVATSQPRSGGEYEQTLYSVLSEAEKLGTIIKSLLELASMESDIRLQKRESVRVDELLWEIQAELKQRHPDQVLQIDMPSMPEDENELSLTGNKQLLLLAFDNIIRNAFKFSNNQPVQCVLRQQGQALLISIKDHGIGISEEATSKIFSPFFRTREAHSFEGQGIGLFIAKKIIDLYKGVIEVRSVPGRETIFNISFTKKRHF